MRQPIYESMSLLMNKAGDNLTPDDWLTLTNLTDAAADEAARMAEVVSGIGCLVSIDGQSKARAGNFQDADGVAALLWSLSHSFETVAAMAEVGSYAASKLIPQDVTRGQAMATDAAGQISPGDRVRTVIAGRCGVVAKVYADGSACVRFDDGTPQPEGMGHERVPRAFLLPEGA